jgi:hypothetical protein
MCSYAPPPLAAIGHAMDAQRLIERVSDAPPRIERRAGILMHVLDRGSRSGPITANPSDPQYLLSARSTTISFRGCGIARQNARTRPTRSRN